MKMDHETLKQRIDLTTLAGTDLHRRGAGRLVVKHIGDGGVQKYHPAIEFITSPVQTALGMLGCDAPDRAIHSQGRRGSW